MADIIWVRLEVVWQVWSLSEPHGLHLFTGTSSSWPRLDNQLEVKCLSTTWHYTVCKQTLWSKVTDNRKTYSALFVWLKTLFKSFSLFFFHMQDKSVVMVNNKTYSGKHIQNVSVMITSDHRGKRETNVGDGGEREICIRNGGKPGGEKIATQGAKKA